MGLHIARDAETTGRKGGMTKRRSAIDRVRNDIFIVTFVEKRRVSVERSVYMLKDQELTWHPNYERWTLLRITRVNDK
jgi:hypothetical protein